MDEHQFLRTMIETVKYDYEGQYEKKDEVLGILRYSMIVYIKTTEFTRLTNQRKEYIELRVPIPMLKIARSLQSTFERLASEVYIETPEYSCWGLRIKPKPVELESLEITEHNAQFSEIKDTIIQGIRNAKYTIWIAVAWFTDNEICDELILRKKAGVHVRIITSGEDSNSSMIKRLESNFETVKVPKKGTNRLHDKFCIIDFEYMMHGSYNWSNNAIYNKETLATALDRDFVKQFADEFIRLYVEYK